jgi:hypothetical protein
VYVSPALVDNIFAFCPQSVIFQPTDFVLFPSQSAIISLNITNQLIFLMASALGFLWDSDIKGSNDSNTNKFRNLQRPLSKVALIQKAVLILVTTCSLVRGSIADFLKFSFFSWNKYSCYRCFSNLLNFHTNFDKNARASELMHLYSTLMQGMRRKRALN